MNTIPIIPEVHAFAIGIEPARREPGGLAIDFQKRA